MCHALSLLQKQFFAWELTIILAFTTGGILWESYHIPAKVICQITYVALRSYKSILRKSVWPKWRLYKTYRNLIIFLPLILLVNIFSFRNFERKQQYYGMLYYVYLPNVLVIWSWCTQNIIRQNSSSKYKCIYSSHSFGVIFPIIPATQGQMGWLRLQSIVEPCCRRSVRYTNLGWQEPS